MASSLSELKEQVQALGIEVPPFNAREPYLQALRNFYLKQDYPNGLPYTELTPMLAQDYHALREKEQKELWNNPDWVAQEKINGVRLILHFIKGIGVFAHSRKISDRTFRRTELSDYLLFSNCSPNFSATIDTELTSPNGLQETTALLQTTTEESRRRQCDTPFTINVFDIMSWEGQDIKPKKLSERLTYLPLFHTAIVAMKLSSHFEFLPVFRQGKREIFEKLTIEGKEGIVLKCLNSPYRSSTSRARDGWVKVKRETELTAFVSDFERGRPGSSWENHVASLVFSVNTAEGRVVVAKVSNLPWPLRKEISLHDRITGSLSLEPEIYGSVAMLAGLELSQKVRRLTHPRIKYWCRDLNQTQCVYSRDDLERIRLGDTRTPLLRIVGV